MAINRTLRTVLVALASLVGLAAVVVGFFIVAFDLRFEVTGSGLVPIISFGDPGDHFAALEQNRSQHYSRLLPAPDPAVAPPPAIGTAATRTPDTTGGTNGAEADVVTTPAHDAYWTDFRGPARDGRYTQTTINTDWTDDGFDPIWKQPIGGGYASFVVADSRAFTIEQRRQQEVVAAYDPATGRELWTHSWAAHFQETMGGPGPRATPTWHAGRVYALGATGHLWALNAATGEVVWHRDILDDSGAANLPWAMAGSPLILDDMVIVQPGGSNGWSIVAYDQATGDVAWHALDDVQGYTSPMEVTLVGDRQILTVTAERALGLSIADGRVLWEYPWDVWTVPNMAQPIVLSDDRLFLSASYGRGAAVIQLMRHGDAIDVETVWENNRMKNRFSGSVLLDGYIYGLDESILACVDAATGQRMWKGGRYGYGQLLLAGDHLVVLTEDGDLALVRAIPDRHYEVARFEAINGKTWNVPAIADGRLLVRNAREMAAFDLRLP